jgi:hypothetical protein
MRYYLYISDAKVDMLLPQVPFATKKAVSAKLGFNVGVLSGELQTQRESLDDRVHRLAAVERYLLDDPNVGTLDHPSAWIRDEGSATVAQLVPYGRESARSIVYGGEVVFFFIKTQTAMLALGGSSRHLIGNPPVSQVTTTYSFAPSLAETLATLSERNSILNMSDAELSHYSEGCVTRFTRHPWTGVIMEAVSNIQSGTMNISFLAKRLVSEVECGRNILLATPLYVAQTD